MNTKLGFTATLLAAGLLATPALAADRDDYKAFSQAKTSLTQAIGVAEQNTNGKAMEAEIDEDSGGIHYEVTVLVGDETREVEVDGNTGEVLKTER
jgi:uncharacterized membrane protein YkoI